jgi:hypothetical protein
MRHLRAREYDDVAAVGIEARQRVALEKVRAARRIETEVEARHVAAAEGAIRVACRGLDLLEGPRVETRRNEVVDTLPDCALDFHRVKKQLARRNRSDLHRAQQMDITAVADEADRDFWSGQVLFDENWTSIERTHSCNQTPCVVLTEPDRIVANAFARSFVVWLHDHWVTEIERGKVFVFAYQHSRRDRDVRRHHAARKPLVEREGERERVGVAGRNVQQLADRGCMRLPATTAVTFRNVERELEAAVFEPSSQRAVRLDRRYRPKGFERRRDGRNRVRTVELLIHIVRSLIDKRRRRRAAVEDESDVHARVGRFGGTLA